jgi:broad specificity phosphatase PhoE
VLVVAHGGSIRVIHAFASGLDYVRDHRSIPAVPNCTVVRYVVKQGRLEPID